MLRDSDLIGQFIPQNNLGTVYIFTTTFVPSFKMIHDPNDAVSKLGKNLSWFINLVDVFGFF